MSPHPASHGASHGVEPRSERVADLLRDLGPQLQRGVRAAAVASAEGRRRLATGIPAIDALVGGGLPAGRLSELYGPLSSGRTALGLALLAHATQAGESVGVVDGADAFHPASAAAAGVRLERVLWARPLGATPAARCCERLLQTCGFAAVLLDAAGWGADDFARLPTAVWQRLARAAAAADAALVVLSPGPVTGSFAALSLELRAARARFTESPCLFEGLEIEATLARRREGPLRVRTCVRLDTGRAA